LPFEDRDQDTTIILPRLLRQFSSPTETINKDKFTRNTCLRC